MGPNFDDYPWYSIVSGSEVQQGDFLDLFPLPQYPINMPIEVNEREGFEYTGIADAYNVVVMTQSCDFTKFESKQLYDAMVTLCVRSDLKKTPFASKSKWKPLVDGRVVSAHVLNKCAIEGHELDYQVINLANIFTVPYGYVKKYAAAQGDRLRLLPPYREQLSQSFARSFMRVGLPLDLPSKYPYQE